MLSAEMSRSARCAALPRISADQPDQLSMGSQISLRSQCCGYSGQGGLHGRREVRSGPKSAETAGFRAPRDLSPGEGLPTGALVTRRA